MSKAWDGAMELYKEEGRAEGKVEGEKRGIVRGEIKGRRKVSQLIERLFRDGRQEEVLHCVTDIEFQNALFLEYDL